MTEKSTRALPRNRARRREHKLWHNTAQNTGAFGCLICPTRNTCGMLNVRRPLYSCLDYCCGGLPNCDVVCRNNIKVYVDRVREIDGFELANVPRGRFLSPPRLAHVIPLIFHRNSRSTALQKETVAIPLSALINHKNAKPRFRAIEEIREAFKLADKTGIVLTGTATDPPLERWWKLGDARRRLIRQLVGAGISFATAPNFSLFSDQPRWDDLHSIKRIAIAHQEFLDEGLPCALHINARTETDMKRWAEFVSARPEIQHVAYEFLTGAGWQSRRERHLEWLEQFAQQVGRPLTLVLRGATELVPRLSQVFSEVVVIESTAFMRAMKRQQGLATNRGPKWQSIPTPVGEPIDDLLFHNIKVMEHWILSMMLTERPQTYRHSTN